MIARKREEAMKKKNEREEGEQVERGTYKHRSYLLEGTEEDRFILEDQAQIEEENQVGDRPTAAAPSQLTLTNGISEAVRTKIARNKEEAMTLAIKTKQDKEEAIKKKKDREEGEPVEHESHKKQKSKQSENLKKRHIEDEEVEEVSSSSKRQKENGKKRDSTDVEDAEHENSSKRGKSAGQNGCKQLGCSTHKGIS